MWVIIHVVAHVLNGEDPQSSVYEIESLLFEKVLHLDLV